MNSDASFLTRSPLFADVSSETLERLEHRMRAREFAPAGKAAAAAAHRQGAGVSVDLLGSVDI